MSFGSALTRSWRARTFIVPSTLWAYERAAAMRAVMISNVLFIRLVSVKSFRMEKEADQFDLISLSVSCRTGRKRYFFEPTVPAFTAELDQLYHPPSAGLLKPMNTPFTAVMVELVKSNTQGSSGHR